MLKDNTSTYYCRGFFMNKKEEFEKGLPKWPQMRIIGESVSEELAKEIIIRTDKFFDSMHSSNSHKFDKECRKIFGIPDQPNLYGKWQSHTAGERVRWEILMVTCLKNAIFHICFSTLTSSQIFGLYFP